MLTSMLRTMTMELVVVVQEGEAIDEKLSDELCWKLQKLQLLASVRTVKYLKV